MKQLVDEVFEVPFDEIKNFNFLIGVPFGLITYINNVKYEFLVHLKKDSERLIFCGSGALNANRTYDRTRPHFNRWSWSSRFSESIIYYNDPTLYIHDDIQGGYGVGTKEDYYLEKIAKIAEIIAKTLNFENKDLLFYGSSAGGFTSLMLSILVKNSFSICDIPQFYINELWSMYWPKFKEHIFKDMSEIEILENYGYRLNVIEMMKKEKYVPNAIILLDCTVERDFDKQYLHFFNDLNKLPYKSHENNIKLIINGKYEGHAPINMYETLELVKVSKYLNNSLNYKTLTNKEYMEYIELKKFKNEVCSLFNIPKDNLPNKSENLDEIYKPIYNDLQTNTNRYIYNANIKYFPQIKDTELFDATWYIKEYNLNISKKYALLHYLDIGYKEGKNPCEKFHGDIYLEYNYDIKKSGMNPLVHYELFGKKEGRIFTYFKI